MKLNHDCVRDILLFTEELSINENPSGDKIFKSDRLKKYSKDEVTYAISRLKKEEADFLHVSILYSGLEVYWISISSLTFKGHSYLDTIRDPKIWKETKSITSKVASVSLEIMSSVAADTIKKTLLGT